MNRYHRFAIQVTGLSALLALGACGGGSSSSSDAAAPAQIASYAQLPTPGASVCAGTVRDFFTSIQGSYYGLVDPAYSTGTTLALTKNKVYVVTVSAADCSVAIAADNLKKIGFSYADAANAANSSLTGFSPSKVIPAPASLELASTQYNVSITTSSLAIELERRVATPSGDPDVATGDLLISTYGTADANSVYAISLKASSRR